MENGIVVQFKALQRALARIEAFLTTDDEWREYQSKIQHWPDLPEAEAVVKAKLPASLLQVLESNRLFLARRKILEAIELLVNLTEDPRGYAPPLISDHEAAEVGSLATNTRNNPLNQRIANLEKMISNVIMPDLRRPPMDVIMRSQRRRVGGANSPGHHALQGATKLEARRDQSDATSLNMILSQLEVHPERPTAARNETNISPRTVPDRALEIASTASKSRFLEALTGRLKK